MTETRPQADAGAAAPATEEVVIPPEPTGLAGVFTTADHKRIGRFFMATSLLFLVGAAVINVLLRVERTDAGLLLFSEENFGQVFGLHAELVVLAFLLPFLVGLATHLVPLQVGAPDIAFARGSATAYWTYLLAVLVLLGAYVADGGFTGGDAVAVDLYLVGLGAIGLALVVALVSVLTTIVTQRAPGMTLDRTPLLTFASLVGGGMVLLTTPLLVARLFEQLVAHRGGELGSYEAISWFWSVPTVYLLTIPVLGIALEVAAVSAGTRLRQHEAALLAIGATGILAFGAFAQVDEATEGVGSIVHVGLSFATILPVLAVLGLLGDTARRGSPGTQTSFLCAVGAVVHLFLGTLAGAAQVIEPLGLAGTTWEAGQLHHVVYGGGVLGALAALWFWAPKLWGVRLGEAAGKAAFAGVFLGTLLLAGPELLAGLLQDQPLASPTFDDDALTVTLNVVSTAGAALVALGVLVAFGDVLGRGIRGKGRPAGDDPWQGHTLEWATTSPPPRSNFLDAIPVVSSPTPVLDDRSPDTEVSA